MQVLILGYGEMGHAMETLLGPRHDIAIWEKYPDPGFQSARLGDAVPQADFVIFCLPVKPHREVLEQIKPGLKPGSVCISIAKGLDEAGHTVCDVFEGVLSEQYEFALLYGPMIAEDIRAGRWAFAQAGCRSRALFKRIHELFDGNMLRLAHSTDLTGISWAAVLKNVYAILFGVVDELKLGDNLRGFLMVRALQELGRIVVDMGGDSDTAYQLAGLGDLVTTATSAGSHHRALGGKLARGETADIAGEGVHTLAMVAAHSLLHINQYPLLAAVREMMEDPRQVRELLRRYIQAPRA